MTGPVDDAVGRVREFDADAGLGRVEADDGDDYPFHCVAIADGSRHIEVGARIRFRVGPGLPGRWEARDIRPINPEAAPA